MEIIEGDGGHRPTDLGGQRLAEVANEVGHGEELGGVLVVGRVSDFKVPVVGYLQLQPANINILAVTWIRIDCIRIQVNKINKSSIRSASGMS